jgi:hypothetical protein
VRAGRAGETVEVDRREDVHRAARSALRLSGAATSTTSIWRRSSWTPPFSPSAPTGQLVVTSRVPIRLGSGAHQEPPPSERDATATLRPREPTVLLAGLVVMTKPMGRGPSLASAIGRFYVGPWPGAVRSSSSARRRTASVVRTWSSVPGSPGRERRRSTGIRGDLRPVELEPAPAPSRPQRIRVTDQPRAQP